MTIWTISGQWDFADIKILNYNDLTIDVRTENPRVGGSIPSRPTTLIYLKSGTYGVFVSIFFYFFSLFFTVTGPNGQPFRVDLPLL